MKNKIGSFLIGFTIFYSVLKVVHFSYCVYNLLDIILDNDGDDCEYSCIFQYMELIFILCLLIFLLLLFYGVIKSKQSYVGLWLVFHALLIMFQFGFQYLIRFSSQRDEYSEATRIYKSIELSFDMISFYIICRLNNALIDERASKAMKFNTQYLKY
ncbi:hypothetical protein ACKWTF_008484 [Chironomus riparius]